MDESSGQQNQLFDAVDILRRIRNGDTAAEGALVRHFSRGLLLMLVNRSGDTELAADLHQETFIVVLNRLRSDGIENPAQIKPFIWATANNLFINEYRKQKRRNTWTDSDRFNFMEDSGADILSQMESEQSADVVREALQSLPVERDREVLYRYFISGEEKTRICSDLALDPHHFDRVVYRAKQRLKQILMVRLQ